MHRPLAGPRKLPPCSCRSPGPAPAVNLSKPVTPATKDPSPSLPTSFGTQLAPNCDSTPGPPITAPPGQPADASRPRNGTGTAFDLDRLAGWGRGVGVGVRPGDGVGVGLDADPHTDPIVHLSAQVSRYPVTVVVCCDRPSSGVSPGGDAYPYQH
jgi:hypothetical protein